MRKFNKVLSLILATVMSGICVLSNMLCNLPCISAEESVFGLPSPDDYPYSVEQTDIIEESTEAEETKQLSTIYTLEQLFAMSDEEFLELEGAQSLYNEKIESDYNNVVTGSIYYWLGDDNDNGSYIRGKTEKELSALLGNTVKYEFIDPIDSVPEYEKTGDKDKISYMPVFQLTFSDYSRLEEDTKPFDSMGFAKCRYCVNQIIPTKYVMADVPLGMMCQTRPRGDVDNNNEIGIADITCAAKHNIGMYPLNSAQLLVGDMNNDGIVDSLDISALIEYNLGKK